MVSFWYLEAQRFWVKNWPGLEKMKIFSRGLYVCMYGCMYVCMYVCMYGQLNSIIEHNFFVISQTIISGWLCPIRLVMWIFWWRFYCYVPSQLFTINSRNKSSLNFFFFLFVCLFFVVFKLSFTPFKDEQSLRGMELQEKRTQAQKGLSLLEICLGRTYS